MKVFTSAVGRLSKQFFDLVPGKGALEKRESLHSWLKVSFPGNAFVVQVDRSQTRAGVLIVEGNWNAMGFIHDMLQSWMEDLRVSDYPQLADVEEDDQYKYSGIKTEIPSFAYSELLDLEGSDENTITSVTYYSPQDQNVKKSETNSNLVSGDQIIADSIVIENIKKDKLDLEISFDTVKEEDSKVKCEDNDSVSDENKISKIEKNEKCVKKRKFLECSVSLSDIAKVNVKKPKSDAKKNNISPVPVPSLATQRSRRSIINKYVSSSENIRTPPPKNKRKTKEKITDISVSELELAAMSIKEEPLDDVSINNPSIDEGTTNWCESDIKIEETIGDNDENIETTVDEKSMKKQKKKKVLKKFKKKILQKQQESVKSEQISNADEKTLPDNSDDHMDDTAHGLSELKTEQDDNFQSEGVESNILKPQGRPKGRKNKSYKRKKSTASRKGGKHKVKIELDSGDDTVDETKPQALFDESECNWHYSDSDSDESDGLETIIGDDKIQRSEKKQNIADEVKNSKDFEKADSTNVTILPEPSLYCDKGTISVTDILKELAGVIENPDDSKHIPDQSNQSSDKDCTFAEVSGAEKSPKRKKFRCDEYEEHKPFCKKNTAKVFTGGKTSYKCNICNAHASGLQYMYYHVIRMHTKKKYKCKICAKTFAMHMDGKVHMRLHKKRYVCELCVKHVATKQSLDQHFARIHKFKPSEYPSKKRCEKADVFTCDRCSFKTGLRKHLHKHFAKIHHDKEFTCPYCSKIYTAVIDFEHHLLSHERKYPCPECGKCLKSKTALKLHISCLHLKVDIRPKQEIMCSLCGHLSHSSTEYRVHKNKVHLKVRPFKCELCDGAFYSKQALKNHQMVHDDSRNFVCDVCSKAFKTVNLLNAHKIYHGGERKFKCDCGKSFLQKATLQRHERIHSGERPFMCHLCQASFSDSSILRRHMTGIHKVDKFKFDKSKNLTLGKGRLIRRMPLGRSRQTVKNALQAPPKGDYASNTVPGRRKVLVYSLSDNMEIVETEMDAEEVEAMRASEQLKQSESKKTVLYPDHQAVDHLPEAVKEEGEMEGMMQIPEHNPDVETLVISADGVMQTQAMVPQETMETVGMTPQETIETVGMTPQETLESLVVNPDEVIETVVVTGEDVNAEPETIVVVGANAEMQETINEHVGFTGTMVQEQLNYVENHAAGEITTGGTLRQEQLDYCENHAVGEITTGEDGSTHLNIQDPNNPNGVIPLCVQGLDTSQLAPGEYITIQIEPDQQ